MWVRFPTDSKAAILEKIKLDLTGKKVEEEGAADKRVKTYSRQRLSCALFLLFLVREKKAEAAVEKQIKAATQDTHRQTDRQTSGTTS